MIGLIKIKMIVTMFRKVLINEEQKCKRSKCRKSLVVAGVKEDENFHWCAGLWKDSIYMENSKAFPAMGNLLSCFNQWKNSQSAFSLQKILSCLRNLIKFKLILLEKFLGSKSRLGVVYQTAGYFFCFLMEGSKIDVIFLGRLPCLISRRWQQSHSIDRSSFFKVHFLKLCST